MADAYAGIAVPEGDPGALRDSAGRMRQVSGGLRESASELEGMPSVLGSWQGPASAAYAGSCLSRSEVALRAAEGWSSSAGAVEAFADELKEARREAREAIVEAREAKRRIERAEAKIEAARGRLEDALSRAGAATRQLSVSGAAGTPDPSAERALRQAEADADAAEEEIRHWRKERDDAERELERAQRRGERAERQAEQAAYRARSALGSISDAMPQWVPPSAPALVPPEQLAPKRPSSDGDGWLERAADNATGWAANQVSQVPGGIENGVNRFGGMLEQGYRGSPITRALDPDSYDPSADPSSPLYRDPLVEDPIGYAKGIVNWEDFSQGRFGEGLGEFIPGLLAGGVGGLAARTGGRAVPDRPAAPTTTPVPPPHRPVRGAPEIVAQLPSGKVVFRTDADGNIVPPLRQIDQLTTPPTSELLGRERSLLDRPHEVAPGPRTKKQAAMEAARGAFKALDDLGG